MTKKDQVRGSHRINDAMLDEMLTGTDAATRFHSGELFSELWQRPAEPAGYTHLRLTSIYRVATVYRRSQVLSAGRGG